MPQPTREQFDAAAKKVAASAPPGLSKEQFYALIDKELAGPGLERVSNEEPGTFRGGFIKGLKSELSGLMPMLESAAHPKSLGDFMSLLIPSEAPAVEALGEAGSLVGEAGRRYGHALRNPAPLESKSILKGIVTYPKRAGQTLKANLPSEMEKAVAPFRSGPPVPPVTPTVSRAPSSTPAPTPFHEKPLYQQMGEIPETPAPIDPRGGGPIASGVEDVRRSPSDVRVAGKAPKLEEVLNDVLTESMGQEPPGSVGLPTSPEPSGGAIRQSGKFGKSQSLGQPGGYSSGLPPVSETRYQEILGGKPEGGTPPIEPPPTLDPAIVAEERRMYGSDEAAKRLGIPVEEVLRLAPGPSRTPITAEERIHAASMGANQSEGQKGLEEILRQMIEERAYKRP